MRSKSITDQLDPADGFSSTAGAEFSANFLFSAGHEGADPSVNGGVPIPLIPALTSEAALSLAAQSGPITVTSMTAGGITINLLFDAAAMAAPASFRAGIQQAASLLT